MNQWPCKHDDSSGYSSCCECEREMLNRIEQLETAIAEALALVTSRDSVVSSPFDALGVYKLALEHLRTTSAKP